MRTLVPPSVTFLKVRLRSFYYSGEMIMCLLQTVGCSGHNLEQFPSRGGGHFIIISRVSLLFFSHCFCSFCQLFVVWREEVVKRQGWKARRGRRPIGYGLILDDIIELMLIVLGMVSNMWEGQETCLWASLGPGEHIDLALGQGPTFTNSSREEGDSDKLLCKSLSKYSSAISQWRQALEKSL